MAGELSYHQKMAREAEVRAQILWEGRPDPSPSPKIYIDPARRREVEAFAARLRAEIAPPSGAAPERAEYARMDAAAMLSRLAGGRAQVLEALQNAILNQDMGAFVETLESNKIGTPADRNNLRHFIAKQDRDAIAACIRMMGRRTLGRLEEAGVGQVDVGLEKANPTDPLMFTTRRLRVTTYLRGNDINNPAPFRRPPHSNVLPETLSAIDLGDDAEDWERDLQYHAYVHDGANAAMNLMEEAAGYGQLDGRINGERDKQLAEYAEYAA